MNIELKTEPGPDAQGRPMFKAFYRINGGDWVRVTGIWPTERHAYRHAAYAAAEAV